MSDVRPAGVDSLRSLPPFDLGVLVTGVLAFIVSFFPYWGVKGSVEGISGSSSVTAWHSYSTVALLLILLATVIAGAAILAGASLPNSPVGLRWIAAGVSALGGLLYVIRLFTLPHHSSSFAGASFDYGVRWGGWLLLIVVLANVVCTAISALSSDEQVPWASRPAPPAI